jgi:hypothetical protein
MLSIIDFRQEASRHRPAPPLHGTHAWQKLRDRWQG